jgi:hypothetical protein
MKRLLLLLVLDGLGHIDSSNAVAAKHQPSSTFADPLHKNKGKKFRIQDYIRMILGN